MAERNAVSRLLNGDGPSQPSGSSGSGSSGSGSAGGSSGSSFIGGPYGTGGGSGSGSVPPSTPSSPIGGGNDTIFTAAAIRALGGKIAALAPMLEKVSSSLEEAEVEAEAWSGSGVALANVYPQGWTFAKNDAKSKASQLDEMAQKLKSTAMTWEKAEQAATVQPAK